MDDKITINSNGETLEIFPIESQIQILKKQAIAVTLNLLELEAVDFMIYIDDKFDIEGQRQEFTARLIYLKNNSNHITTENFKDLEWDAPDAKFESLINKLWEESQIKQDLLSEICRHFQDDDSANIIPVLEITKCYGDKIKLMTPDDWVKDKYKTIIDLAEGKKALCLFDYEFQNGNSFLEGKNGAQLAKALIEQEAITDKVVCGIFSHKFSEHEEDEYRKKYAQDYSIDIKKFYTVSKNRYANDPQIGGFAEGIKILLLHPHVEKLKENSLEVLKNSSAKASERIKEISPSTFNQIIQKSSLKEGVWEVSTLFRLYGILSKEENFNIISDPAERQNFNDSINRIRQIDLIDTGYNSVLKNEQLINLHNSELYIKGEIINNLHLPLTNGDIFEIKGKEYILLVQPCNLALRAKDEQCGRRDYNYDIGMLIPIKHLVKEPSNITSEEIMVAEPSDKFNIVNFPEFQIISLNILDLCIFNVEGKSSIDFNSNTLQSDVIHSPWLKRYEYIHKALLPYETKVTEFSTIKLTVSKTINQKRGELQQANAELKEQLKAEIAILQSHLNNTEKNVFDLSDLNKFKIDCKKIYNSETRILDMGIRRVRHYKSPYSDNLLQKFMLYLSRNAFEHDITSF